MLILTVVDISCHFEAHVWLFVQNLCAFTSFKCATHSMMSSQTVHTKNVFIWTPLFQPGSVWGCVPLETTRWISPSKQPSVALDPPPQPTHTHMCAHTTLLPVLGPRVNGCSTFPLSRSAKNYLLNDVCINIIYMVISFLLITAGLNMARRVGWSCVKLICQWKIWW